MTFAYFVSTDSDAFPTDDGDYQVSLLTQKVFSSKQLTDDEAVELAEEEGDWEIQFGEGDYATLNEYQVEHC
jgi:hypothetical protein